MPTKTFHCSCVKHESVSLLLVDQLTFELKDLAEINRA